MSSAIEFIEAEASAAAPHLGADAIHLWRIPYALSQQRAPLVTLLAAYLGIPESAVVLEQDQRGKPRLAQTVPGVRGGRGLDFNWSHSGDYALIALSRDGALGVDIERVGKPLRTLEIAHRFFDPEEAESLAALDPVARERAFIGLWCAKEAVLKAVGKGLSFGLARLAFTRLDAADWELIRVDPALGDTEDWRLAGFEAAPGYRGALAWRGDARRIHAFRPA